MELIWLIYFGTVIYTAMFVAVKLKLYVSLWKTGYENPKKERGEKAFGVSFLYVSLVIMVFLWPIFWYLTLSGANEK